MYLVDTNILLEVLLSRRRKDACKKLLKRLATGEEEGMVTEFSVYSIMVIMAAAGKLKELECFLLSLAKYKNLEIYTLNLRDKVGAVRIMQQNRLDMDDSIQYAVALTIKAEGIISFDKDFDGLDIPRVEPQMLAF